MLWTKCIVWFLIGVGLLIQACTKWHGDPKSVLLLELLNAQGKNTAKNSPVSYAVSYARRHLILSSLAI